MELKTLNIFVLTLLMLSRTWGLGPGSYGIVHLMYVSVAEASLISSAANIYSCIRDLEKHCICVCEDKASASGEESFHSSWRDA